MRRRLVVSTILVVTIVLVVLSVPVTLVLREAATNEIRARTSQQASTVAAVIDSETSGSSPS